MLSYLFYAAVSLISHPNSTTICKTSDVCSIEWSDTIDSHAHLEVQVKYNNSWISTTTSGKSFLSVIVDEETNNYNWYVPQYLGQFWETPKRVVLEDMTTGENYYSADFTVPGITLDMHGESNLLDSQTNVRLSWSSNDDSKFGLYLLQDEIIVDTIHNATLSPNSSYEWTVPYLPNNQLQIMVRSIDENTYTVTESFRIAETTITPTTTETTTPTTTETTTRTTTDTSTPTTTDTSTTSTVTTTGEIIEPTTHIEPFWYIVIPLLALIGVALIYLVYKYISIVYCYNEKSNKIYPMHVGASIDVKQSIPNPVYDRNSRSLPPISPPTNFKLISSYTYPDENIYEEAPNNPTSNYYDRLNRQRSLVNGAYA